MPINKKESLIFTFTMCFLMVFGMSIYNLVLHNSFSVAALMVGLVPGCTVAFLLDLLFVGKIAKKLAFKLPVNREKNLHKILTISICMVIGMVLCMSFYGVVFEQGITADFLDRYMVAVKLNFVVALPLQLVVVGPISRRLLTFYQKD